MNNTDRFKFRWFDKSTKMMYEVISLNVEDDYAVVRGEYADEYTPDEEVKISDGILMQCTGLKDKNEKLIYEGDIIKYEEEESNWNLTQIGFRDGQFCFIINAGMKEEYCESLLNDWNEEWQPDFEIVGNIYEHTELIKS